MKILLYPHPALRKYATPVAEVSDEIRVRAREMLDLMYAGNGVGLAAPQVGWSVRLLVSNTTGRPEDEKIFINPEIVATRDNANEEEGCLSFPGIYAKVLRAKWVRVQALDLEGNPFTLEADGLLARCVQHEIDHLDGMLFIHRMTRATRLGIRGQLKGLERRYREESLSSATSLAT